MKILTPKGIAEGRPLSDIQEYNIQLKRNTKAVYVLIAVILLLFILSFWYVKHYNVVEYPVNILKTIATKCV